MRAIIAHAGLLPVHKEDVHVGLPVQEDAHVDELHKEFIQNR